MVFVVALSALLVVAWLLGQPYLAARRRTALRNAVFPAEWEALLEERVPRRPGRWPQRGDPRIRTPARPGEGLRQRRAAAAFARALPALVGRAEPRVRAPARRGRVAAAHALQPLRRDRSRGVLRGRLGGVLRAAAAHGARAS